jgi:uncharacterized protein YukE
MASSDEMLNIVWDSAQQSIQSFQSQGKKISETIDHVKSNVGVNVMPGVWDGDSAIKFSQWMLTKWIPAAEELASSAIPGFGSAFSQIFDIMNQAEGQLFNMADECNSVFKF